MDKRVPARRRLHDVPPRSNQVRRPHRRSTAPPLAPCTRSDSPSQSDRRSSSCTAVEPGRGTAAASTRPIDDGRWPTQARVGTIVRVHRVDPGRTDSGDEAARSRGRLRQLSPLQILCRTGLRDDRGTHARVTLHHRWSASGRDSTTATDRAAAAWLRCGLGDAARLRRTPRSALADHRRIVACGSRPDHRPWPSRPL
jgi:hypothetical protein